MFPQVYIREDWVGVHAAEGGVLSASKAVAIFQSLALKNGAVLPDNAAVVKVDASWILHDGTHGVHEATVGDGLVGGTSCVMAACAWTNKLVRDLCAWSFPFNLSRPPLPTEMSTRAYVASALRADEGFPVFAAYGALELYGTPFLEYPGLIKSVCPWGKGLPSEPSARCGCRRGSGEPPSWQDC